MELEYEKLLDKLFNDMTLDDSDMFTGMLAKLRESVEELRGESPE